MMSFMNKKSKGFTLVELMIVVAIIGILAAIAIPAFLRYIKSSKAAEADGIMKKMTDGAKSYFTSEQKYAAAADGDQPWHPSTAGTSTAAGLPVTFASYVFPGGSGFAFNSLTVAACGVNPAASPKGGSKILPTPAVIEADAVAKAAVNKLNITLGDPTYFLYCYETAAATGTAAQATVDAYADFRPASPDMHHVQQIVSIDVLTQEVFVGPTVLTFEFE